MGWFGKKEKSLAEQAQDAQKALAKLNNEATLRAQIASANTIICQRNVVNQRKALEPLGLRVTVLQDVVNSNNGSIPIQWTVSGLIGSCATVCLMKDGHKARTLWESVMVEEDGTIEYGLGNPNPMRKDKQNILVPLLGRNYQIRFMTETGFTALSNCFEIAYVTEPYNQHNNQNRRRQNRNNNHP